MQRMVGRKVAAFCLFGVMTGGCAVEPSEALLAPDEPTLDDGSIHALLADIACRGHTATVLADHRVLVVGACRWRDQPFGAAIVDGERQRLVPFDRRPLRVGHCASVLSDGRVVIVGGVEVGAVHSPDEIEGPVLADAEAFLPETGEWETLPSMRVARVWHACVTLPGDDLLVAGGLTEAGGAREPMVTRDAERFDAGAMRWTTVEPMAVARYRHSAVVLDRGDVLVAGGFGVTSGGDERDAGAERWDGADDKWSEVAFGAGLATTSIEFGYSSPMIASPAGAFLFGAGEAFRFNGIAFEAPVPVPGFWALAAAYAPTYGYAVIGLGYYGGAEGAVADTVASDWSPRTIPQISARSFVWVPTMSVLPGGRLLLIGTHTSTVVGHSLK